MQIEKPKTVVNWARETPKITDVVLLDKYLKEEKESKRPRSSVIEIIEKQIEKLSLIPKETIEKSTKNIPVEEAEEILESKEVVKVDKPTRAEVEVVFPSSDDVLATLDPFRIILDKINLDDIVWSDSNDKVGYKLIKDNKSALVKMRGNIEAQRKTFNAPFSNVISESNTQHSKITADIKHIEGVLKDRLDKWDAEQARLTKLKNEKKEKEIAERKAREQALLEEEEKNKQKTISGGDFKSKYGGIIDRAKSNLKVTPIEEIRKKDNTPFGSPDIKPSLFEQEPLSDEDEINRKLSLLTNIVEGFDIPDSSKFSACNKVVDKNVLKLIDYLASQIKSFK